MLERTEAYGLDFLYPAGDEAIGASLRDYGEFARVMSDFLIEHAVEPTGTMIDVGANIGSICLPFAAAKPAWRTLAVEASRQIASVLSANALNNRLMNVEVVQAAAGGATKVVEFPNAGLDARGNYGTLSLDKVHTDMAATLMVTLDDIAPADTRLVKVDAEGQDPAVLAGAPRLLHDVRPIWLVEADPMYPQVAEPVIRTLLGAGYSVFWFFAPWAGPKPLRGAPPPNAGLGDTNVVALPPGRTSPWGMTPVTAPTERRPAGTSGYPYLARYGHR